MIYDCFTFFNELEMLDLRLNELDEVVDKFVLVEATATFTGKPKELFFQKNRKLFSKFNDKIIHVVVEDMPIGKDAWAVERFQRNCIARGLTGCRPDDLILVSDVDEIPCTAEILRFKTNFPYETGPVSNMVHKFLTLPIVQNVFSRKGFRRRLRKNHPFIIKFRQSQHMYYLNCAVQNDFRYGTRMLYFRDFSTAEEIRHSGYKIVKNGGWHFTYMGGGDRIRNKITAFSHQELNTPEKIEQIINTASSISENDYFRLTALEELPSHVQLNPQKFSDLLYLPSVGDAAISQGSSPCPEMLVKT